MKKLLSVLLALAMLAGLSTVIMASADDEAAAEEAVVAVASTDDTAIVQQGIAEDIAAATAFAKAMADINAKLKPYFDQYNEKIPAEQRKKLDEKASGKTKDANDKISSLAGQGKFDEALKEFKKAKATQLATAAFIATIWVPMDVWQAVGVSFPILQFAEFIISGIWRYPLLGFLYMVDVIAWLPF